MSPMILRRRDALRLGLGATAAALLPSLARAQTVGIGSGYRALVAVFLFGGCDGANVVAPLDARYGDYALLRGPSLALPRDRLIALPGTAFGLHPSLAPIAPFWNAGALALAFNVGPLVEPLTRATFLARPDLHPRNLFSHDDQQAAWQTAEVAAPSATGWAGRTGDRLAAGGARFPVVSIDGARLALLGDSSRPLTLTAGTRFVRAGLSGGDAATLARKAAFEALLAAPQDGRIARRTAEAMASDYEAGALLDQALTGAGSAVGQYFVDGAGAPLTSGVALQLQRAARLIEARALLGASRQIFFCGQGGYDTHDAQVGPADPTSGRHASLLSDLAWALRGFQNAMTAIGRAGDVALFTASDFGRVMQGNGSRGSDHAWGNHHIVLSGALAPRRLHGLYPDLAFAGPDDARDDGRWIPSTSLEEYLGGLVRWLGVASADMGYVFPNWANWSGGGRGPLAFFG